MNSKPNQNPGPENQEEPVSLWQYGIASAGILAATGVFLAILKTAGIYLAVSQWLEKKK